MGSTLTVDNIKDSGDNTLVSSTGSGHTIASGVAVPAAGITGTLGSEVSYPTGHVIQTFGSGITAMANNYTGSASTDIQLALSGITSGNKVLLNFACELSHNTATSTSDFCTVYLESPTSGAVIGSTTSGIKFVNEFGRYGPPDWSFIQYNISVLVPNVTAEAPVYRLYNAYSSGNFVLYYTNCFATAQEIQA